MTEVYVRHDQSAMPQLNGTVGSAIAVLDSILLPAGWTGVFTGSNVKVYQSSAADGGVGCFLKVDDSGSGAGGARECSIEAFSNMTDINTGVFGTGKVWFRKSSSIDSVSRNWLGIADEHTLVALYAWDTGDMVPLGGSFSSSSLVHAGQLDCLDPSNAFRYGVFGRSMENTPNDYNNYGMLMGDLTQFVIPTGNSFRCLSPIDGSVMTPYVYGNYNTDQNPSGNAQSNRANYGWAETKPLNSLWIVSDLVPNPLFYRLRKIAVPLFNLADSHGHNETVNDDYVACFVEGEESGGNTQLVSALCVYIGDV